MGSILSDDVNFNLLLLLYVGFIFFSVFAFVLIYEYSGWEKRVKITAICVWILICLFGANAATMGFAMFPMEIMAKPVIYLYPESEMRVDVSLSNPEDIICDYPEYNDGWKVIADKDGNIKDLTSGKNLYCLYYESNALKSKVCEDGFVVESADIADFLDEKLEILGLNDKERNEFIIYWLPKLEQNEYNYIRFLTTDEINAVQELSVDPKPDTMIRVVMSYKGLDKPIHVNEQKLKTAERAGFTVVEWGGTEIK